MTTIKVATLVTVGPELFGRIAAAHPKLDKAIIQSSFSSQ